jgi:ribosomal protein L37AE/L43A
MFSEKCPVCGTHGKIWNKSPEVWKCPNCSSIFSQFGLVIEAEKEAEDFWS